MLASGVFEKFAALLNKNLLLFCATALAPTWQFGKMALTRSYHLGQQLRSYAFVIEERFCRGNLHNR